MKKIAYLLALTLTSAAHATTESKYVTVNIQADTSIYKVCPEVTFAISGRAVNGDNVTLTTKEAPRDLIYGANNAVTIIASCVDDQRQTMSVDILRVTKSSVVTVQSGPRGITLQLR